MRSITTTADAVSTSKTRTVTCLKSSPARTAAADGIHETRQAAGRQVNTSRQLMVCGRPGEATNAAVASAISGSADCREGATSALSPFGSQLRTLVSAARRSLAQALSQDHFVERTNRIWAAS